MEYRSFTVSDAASQLQISPSTLRRWCSDFAIYLSEGARPDKGVYRRLLPADLNILAEVKTFREQGLSVPTIHERLAGMVFQAPIVESPQAAQNSPSDAPGALMVVEALRSVETRLQALEGQRPTWRDVFIIGLATLIAGLMIGLSVWWFQ